MATTYLRRGNAKLSKDTLVWNIPAGMEVCGRECPGCYALKTQNRWKNVKESWERNLELAKSPMFMPTIINEIDRAVKSKNPPRFVRIHGSGEFFSEEYIRAWKYISVAFPEIIFYTYTKRWEDFRSAFNALVRRPNVVVHDSLAGGMINFSSEEKIQKVIERSGGFLCPHSKDRNHECGSLCTWCMDKANEGTPIYFIKH